MRRLFCSPAHLVTALVLFATVLLLSFPAAAQEVDCLKCHAGLLKNKPVVHAAVQMGCPACHTGISDALKVPHKKTTKFAKGLSADQPEVCFGCHDKEKFTKSKVHPAAQMGCTACHNPHASAKPKLLSAEVPEQCFSCHDKAEFSRKNVHPPVAGGMCLSCHNPHSSPTAGMLVKPHVELCGDCHDQVGKRPHAISGFSQAGHPLGQPRTTKKGKIIPPPADPKRTGKPFSCASCHNPHSSDSPRLFRYPAKAAMELCTNCHQF